MKGSSRTKRSGTKTFEQEVREDIRTMIATHRRNLSQCPRSKTQELVVMALLFAGEPDQSLLASEILAWILKAFKYFNNRAIDEYAKARIRGSAEFDFDFSIVVRDFFLSFDYWEAPIYSTCGEIVTTESAQNKELKFKTSFAEGRIFLRKWLDCKQPREQAFDLEMGETGETNTLLKLPREIRTIIFEMVFAFKWPGLIVRSNEFRTFKRISDKKGNLNADITTLRAPSIETMLSLLSVSKAMYSEALPCFYSKNSFFFDTVSEFAHFAQNTSAERRGLLRNIVIMYNSTARGLAGFDKGAKFLSKFKKLQCLEIAVMDDTWFDAETVRELKGDALFKEPKDLPGIKDVAFALHRAASFNIHGPCPRIRQCLEKTVDRLAEADKTKEVERLRKAEQLANARSFKDAKRFEDLERSGGSARSTRAKLPSWSELDEFEPPIKSRSYGTPSVSDVGSDNSEECPADYEKRPGNTDRSGIGRSDASTGRSRFGEPISEEFDRYLKKRSRDYGTESEGGGAGSTCSEGRSSKRRKGF